MASITFQVLDFDKKIMVEGTAKTCGAFLGVTSNAFLNAIYARDGEGEYKNWIIRRVVSPDPPFSDADLAAIRKWDKFVASARRQLGLPPLRKKEV